MEIVRASRVARLLEAAKTNVAARWIAALAAAEAEAEGRKDARRRRYRISYRVGTRASEAKGSEATRRQGLTDIIRSVSSEHHEATSTWDVVLHIEEARSLAGLLLPPLDKELDSLRVAEVVDGNRSKWGPDKLGS